jgi:hypothetical protein
MGPVQLLIVGFAGDEFSGKIGAELERLRENDTIRLLDSSSSRRRRARGSALPSSPRARPTRAERRRWG